MQAPTLEYSQPGKHFILQTAKTKNGLSAVLMPDSGTGLRLVIFGSKTLSEVEKRFSPCEREVLALVWSINHWEYLVGMSPIVLRTLHTPVSYVLSRRINGGRVSNPQLANWPLSLLNKDVQVEKAQSSSTILYSLFTSEEDHKCPLPSEDTNESKSSFLSKTAYKAAKKLNRDIWVVMGATTSMKADHGQGMPLSK
ncbi:unnamed protein product [Lepidochelys olivacea]